MLYELSLAQQYFTICNTRSSVYYMKNTGKSLRVFYNKIIRITCATHGLHIIANQVRDYFSNFNNLISLVSKSYFEKLL